MWGHVVCEPAHSGSLIFQNIDVETQRLIFQGRVLQDEKLLKDYGKTLYRYN